MNISYQDLLENKAEIRLCPSGYYCLRRVKSLVPIIDDITSP